MKKVIQNLAYGMLILSILTTNNFCDIFPGIKEPKKQTTEQMIIEKIVNKIFGLSNIYSNAISLSCQSTIPPTSVSHDALGFFVTNEKKILPHTI